MAEGVDGAGAPVRRILVADDHPLFRQALIASIRRAHRGLAVEEHATFASLEAALARDSRAALALLDLKLPDSAGFAGLLRLREAFPGLPVAIISATEDATTIRQAMVCGAAGYIPKSISLSGLAAALATILGGEHWVPAQALELAGGTGCPLEPLSPAQARVYSGLQRGLMNKQIAYELGVTEATVKAHLTGLFRKLGVQTRTQALLLADSVSSPAMQ